MREVQGDTREAVVILRRYIHSPLISAQVGAPTRALGGRL